MLDFMTISTRSTKRGIIEIYPKFIIRNTSDLMIRGGDFYAIWDKDKNLWSTSELEAVRLIDNELDLYFKENASHFDSEGRVLHLRDSENGMMDKWLKYCQRHMRDSYHMLDERVIFANEETSKSDYASKKLSYSLEKGDTPSWDRLLSVLYSEKERHKIEWAIGSVVTGESRYLQKFFVFHGEGGKGKGTILQIIKDMFEPYCTTFPSKDLGSNNGTFALEAFRNNPLVAIDFDSKLNRIEDNTRLNSLVAHEPVVVNEKFKSTYTNSFKCVLFIGTNNPVKITDAKSGLIRRLIDISPTGETIPKREYDRVVKQVKFEFGAIASKCRDIFLADPNYYDNYVATSMLSATNDFYNFVLSYYDEFLRDNETTATQAYAKYKQYCEDANVPSPMSRMYFKEELKNYFKEYKARSNVGSRPRDYYFGFRTDRFEPTEEEPPQEPQATWLKFDDIPSLLDKAYADCKAQYGNDEDHPKNKWVNVHTTLKDLDTSKLHYVLVPDIHHIFIDFDLKDETGQKSFKLNLEAASKFPPTYAELSKSGVAIHLHYIYTGDPTMLEPLYAPGIEVKVMTGKSALRRRLTKCNDIPIATIGSGLPLRKEAKVVNNDVMMTERGLRTFIKKCLNKSYPPYSTSCNVDYIYKKLEEMHGNGVVYNVEDMHPAILSFAMKSHNQAERCVKLVSEMKFKSDEDTQNLKEAEGKLIFYDVEVFPNLFLVNWKVQGAPNVIRMINPTPTDIENLIKFKLVGFNCRRYDNHILYARLMGYTNKQLFNLSQRIINGDPNCFFSEAYNLSYTDVYDFSSTKQSLKKFEIDLGLYHDELGLPWDEDVPEEMWDRVAEYCDHDVIATEAVFEARKADWLARQILADIAGMTVNDTTNSLSTRIIFGKERHPQKEFNYRNLAGDDGPKSYPLGEDDEYTVFQNGKPIFPGYVYESGKSVYRGVVVGEGGRVYAEPGIYYNVALLDIASMHPSSTIAEWLFGPYTKNFQELKEARVAIKHGDFNKAKRMLGGKLGKYLTDEGSAKDLAQALKIVINSVYGLTSAAFDNPFRDIRNVDNIVAKRGALFMVNLQHEVQERGFTVAHIKTDSIKIPNATPEIIQFVIDYGKLYGYDFEHEATYERMCLVNDAVYIAKYDNGKWTATGTQFQIPYVFKTLFSHEPVEFSDLCETKSVSTALYLDLNEGLPDVSACEKEFDNLAKELKNGSDNSDILQARMSELLPIIESGHNYQFIGKVGLFTPIKPGFGGGELLREVKTPKSTLKKDFASATGAKGFRWLQSKHVEALDLKNAIDISFYEKMADEARKTVSKFGDFDNFVS